MLRWGVALAGGTSTIICGILLRSSVADALLVGFLMIALTFLSVIDLEQRLLPNRLVWPVVGCIWLAVLSLGFWQGAWIRLVVAGLVTVIYTSAFFVLWMRGHLGAGDVKLLAGVLLVPAWFGLGSALVWVIAAWLPVVIAGLLSTPARPDSTPIAQAPFYAIGLLTSVVFTAISGL